MSKTGLAKAEEIYGSRLETAKAYQREGRKVAGYLSMHVPLEIVEAFGLVPFRLTGDIREPVTQADRGLPAAFCPYMRSVLDLSLKGRFDFLDGFVMAHPCDAQEKTVRVISSLVKFPFSHFIDVPSTAHGYSVDYLKAQFGNLCAQLASFTGVEFSREKVEEAIALYDRQRALVRELYDLNRADPPALKGSETLKVILAVQSLAVRESIALLEEVIREAGARGEAQRPSRKPRLLVWGSVIDDVSYVEVIERGGANVVVDDLDEGTRPYLHDVGSGSDPLAALARRYIEGVVTARTFFDQGQDPVKKDNIADLTARYRDLGKFIEGWRVDGALLQSVRYCDPHGYELVDVTNYLKHLGTPHIYVEHNYSEGALAPLRTRIEAFIETLEY